MFVQALAAYADKKLQKELGDVAFEERAVPYFLQIGADGSFLGITPRFEQIAPVNGKGKSKQRSQTYRAPRSPVNRNSGQHPMLAADEIGYVLGPGPWSKPDDIEKVTKLHRAFVSLSCIEWQRRPTTKHYWPVATFTNVAKSCRRPMPSSP